MNRTCNGSCVFGGFVRGVIEDSCRLACGFRRFVYTVFNSRNLWRHTPRVRGSRHRRLKSLVTFLYYLNNQSCEDRMFIICNLRWRSGMQVCGAHNSAQQSYILVLRVLVLAEGRGCCGCAEMTYRKSVLCFERRQGAVRPVRVVLMCLNSHHFLKAWRNWC